MRGSQRKIEPLLQNGMAVPPKGGRPAAGEFGTLNKSLHRLERFWTDQILYRL